MITLLSTGDLLSRSAPLVLSGFGNSLRVVENSSTTRVSDRVAGRDEMRISEEARPWNK